MIQASLNTHDGEFVCRWSGETMYDIIFKFNELLEGGVIFDCSLDSQSLKKQVADQLNSAKLNLISDNQALVNSNTPVTP